MDRLSFFFARERERERLTGWDVRYLWRGGDGQRKGVVVVNGVELLVVRKHILLSGLVLLSINI